MRELQQNVTPSSFCNHSQKNAQKRLKSSSSNSDFTRIRARAHATIQPELPRARAREAMQTAPPQKNTALGYETLGGRAMQGLVTLLELVVVPYLRPVWAYQREARRRLVTP